ncbi:hypothetical protein EON65_54330 [archaeon]|nr:MAG: hypothetical protein EON65_54330 [archaeon]
MSKNADYISFLSQQYDKLKSESGFVQGDMTSLQSRFEEVSRGQHILCSTLIKLGYENVANYNDVISVLFGDNGDCVFVEPISVPVIPSLLLELKELHQAIVDIEEKERKREEASRAIQNETELSLEERKHDAEFLLQQLVISKITCASLNQDLEQCKLKLRKQVSRRLTVTAPTEGLLIPNTIDSPDSASVSTTPTIPGGHKPSFVKKQGEVLWRMSKDFLNLGIDQQTSNPSVSSHQVRSSSQHGDRSSGDQRKWTVS